MVEGAARQLTSDCNLRLQPGQQRDPSHAEPWEPSLRQVRGFHPKVREHQPHVGWAYRGRELSFVKE